MPPGSSLDFCTDGFDPKMSVYEGSFLAKIIWPFQNRHRIHEEMKKLAIPWVVVLRLILPSFDNSFSQTSRSLSYSYHRSLFLQRKIFAYSIHGPERIPSQSNSTLFHRAVAAAAAANRSNSMELYLAVVDVDAAIRVVVVVGTIAIVVVVAAAAPRGVSTHEPWTKAPDFQTPWISSCP